MPAIELRNISKKFGETTVLDRLNLKVEQGQALCLFGPSGCGKSTLLRIMAGLERPDSGEMFLRNTLVASKTVHTLPECRKMSMVFQDQALWPHLSVARHLDFVLCSRGLSRSQRRARADEMLEICRLTNLKNSYPHEMSGGEKQRLAIARALVVDYDALLLDEALANLDADLREVFLAEFGRCKKERGVTIVFATHNPEETERLGDGVFRM